MSEPRADLNGLVVESPQHMYERPSAKLGFPGALRVLHGFAVGLNGPVGHDPA